jgi:hypothetical protein
MWRLIFSAESLVPGDSSNVTALESKSKERA